MANDAEQTEAYRSLCYGDSVFKERYEGWEELGQGGHAVVARVHSRVLDKDIALKIFTPLATDDRPRFQREANNAAEVSSPFIVRPMGVFVRGSLGWIEMELVDGPDLGRELDRRAEDGEPFTLLEALDVAVDVTSGLVHAHQASLIHRDIKPANIYLPQSRRPAAKLGDFGIARLSESMKLTKTDVFRGTPEWTSPEGADGKALEAPHDVYCLGLTLFSLFTNNGKAIPLPPNPTPQAVLRAHLKQQPRPARTLNPALPPSIEDLLGRCLLKRPPDGRPTAGRLLEELRAIRHAVQRSTPSSAVALQAPSRRRWVRVGIGLGVLAAVTAFGLLALRAKAPPSSPLVQPSLAVALGTDRVATESGQPAEGVAITAVIEGDFLRLSTADEALSDVELVLVGRTQSFVHKMTEPLEPSATVFVPLDEFRPRPLADEAFQELRVTRLGQPSVTLLTVPLVRR